MNKQIISLATTLIIVVVFCGAVSAANNSMGASTTTTSAADTTPASSSSVTSSPTSTTSSTPTADTKPATSSVTHRHSSTKSFYSVAVTKPAASKTSSTPSASQSISTVPVVSDPTTAIDSKTNSGASTYTNTATINSMIIGQEKYGYVVKYGPYGNLDSTEIVAYIIGVHPLEYIAHESLKRELEAITDLTKQYYIYQVVVTQSASNYNQGRMNGQLLAQKYVVPDILAYSYKLAVDIHANDGNYPYGRFVFSPINSNEIGLLSENYARQIDNDLNLPYYVPPGATSPPYVTIPLIDGGTPAIIVETLKSSGVESTDAFMSLLVKEIDSINLQNNIPAATVTINQLKTAATYVKTYYESHQKSLPANVLINGNTVTMPQLLYLLTTATIQINNHNLNPITIKIVNPPTAPSGSFTSGNIQKASFLTYAQNIQSFINNNGGAPNYATTNLGRIPFKYLVYMYSKIIDYYAVSNRLPNYVAMNP